MTPAERKAVLALARTVVETVNEAGPGGAPAGVVFAALMTAMPSMTANTFNVFVGQLATAGYLRRDNHVLYGTGKVMP